MSKEEACLEPGHTVIKVYRLIDDKPMYTKKFDKEEFSRSSAWATVVNADPPTRTLTDKSGKYYTFTVPITGFRNAHLKNHWRWKISVWECEVDRRKVR